MSSQLDEAPAGRHTRLAECLERARGGEMDALTDVVRELNPLLWQVARAQGLSTEDAIDVVQTTWLELIRTLHAIRTPQALTAWLVTTTRRGAWHLNARHRRQATAGDEALEDRPDPGPDPADVALTDERDRVLMRHFNRLSARCRQLLRIVATVERPDYDEVAEVTRMPRGSVGPTRGRCLAKLREHLLSDPQWRAT